MKLSAVVVLGVAATLSGCGGCGGTAKPPPVVAPVVGVTVLPGQTIITELLGSVLILTGFYRWIGAVWLGSFTLIATFVANRFWEIPLPDRFMVENAFFEHLGLVGAFLLVAWYDLQQKYSRQIGERNGRARLRD